MLHKITLIMAKLGLCQDSGRRSATYRYFSRCMKSSLLVAAIVFQNGCVVPVPARDTEYQSTLGKVTVVASTQMPDIRIVGMGGAGEGAAQVSGKTAATCLNIALSCPCGGYGCIACAPQFLFGAVCLVAATPLAALAGAGSAPDTRQRQKYNKVLLSPLNATAIQQALRDKVAAAALADGVHLPTAPSAGEDDTALQDRYRSLSSSGMDAILEVAVTDVQLDGAGIDPPLTLVMKAHARLVKIRDSSEITSADFYYYADKRMKLSKWMDHDGEQLVRGLNLGYEELGTDIYDSIFLLYPYPYHKIYGVNQIFGLAPLEPSKSTYQSPLDAKIREDFAHVYSLAPRLSWERFPRRSDIQVAPAAMKRVRNVRYDLAIYQLPSATDKTKLFELVYRRNGLPTNAHRVETFLLPDTLYVWSVRARFELDGRRHVTEWSRSLMHGAYVFETPKHVSIAR